MTTLSPAIGYIRVGSPEPKTLANEFQKQQLEQWAATTGHQIVEWVEEHGVSGASHAFDEAVDRCRDKVIVAAACDRVSRHLAVLVGQARKVEAAGGRLAFVDSWPEGAGESWQDLAAATAEDSAVRQTVSAYRRRKVYSDDEASPQRQAAAARECPEARGRS